jgi:drug/metabolite transporter (DMT)-like permease
MKQRISWERVKKNLRFLLFSGFSLGANWIFLFEAYRHTTISRAALSYYFAPVFVMILSPAVLKERLSRKKAACIAAAVLGMFLIIGRGADAAVGARHLLGAGCGLLAAGFYASLMLTNKFIKNMAGLEITLIQLATASLLLAPYVFVTEGSGMFPISGRSLLFVFILGIVHTGVGFYLFFTGMQNLSGQSMATLSYIDPVTSLILSALILREEMTFVQLAGAAMLLSSIFISEKNFLKKSGVNHMG